MRTIIGVCLDESGSMDEQNKRNAAISSFNEFLHTQQKETADECHMAIARFNTVSRVSDKMQPVAAIKDLARDTYIPSGGTALYDAIAYVVREVEGGVKDDDRVVIVILTDGEENSSQETTLDQVKELIAAKEATQRWNFVYLSAGLNAFAVGAAMGVRSSNVGQLVNSGAGYAYGTRAVSANLAGYRRGSATMAVGMSAGVNMDEAEEAPAVQGGHTGPIPSAMTPQGPPTITPPVPVPPPQKVERSMWTDKGLD